MYAEELTPMEPQELTGDVFEEETSQYTPECSCKVFVAQYVDMPFGDADSFDPNIPRPMAGSVALLRYGDVPHMSYVKSVSDGFVVVMEGNYEKCRITERTVALDDLALRGFWLPPYQAAQIVLGENK